MAGLRRRQDEHGSALVEYVLLLGFVAVIATTSLKALGATASAQFGTAATQLANPDPAAGTSTAVDGGSGSAGTGDTMPPTTTPPTTVAPTTTVPPTTVPPTTLPPVATKGSTDLAAPTITRFGSYWWATSQLTVTDNLGAPISGARVTLTIREYTKQWNGTWQWETSTQTITSDSDGSVGFSLGLYYGGSTSGSVTQVTVAVSAVTLPNGLAWDGDPSTITVNGP